MQPSSLERAVINWLIAHTTDARLKRQLQGATVVKRDHTSVGQYTDLRPPPGSAPAIGPSVVDGPEIRAPGLTDSAGCHLVLEAGLLDYLEFFAYGEHFPVDPEDFTLVTTE